MAYRIRGLDPEPFVYLFSLDAEELLARGIRRMTADCKPGFPCRVSLEDAEPGENLLLLNHCSHAGANPYRATHAIFVRERATEAALYEDELPPVFHGRTLSLRAFDVDGMMADAALASGDEISSELLRLLGDARVDHIDVHNAVRGCFSARVERR